MYLLIGDRVTLVFMIYNPSSEMNARTGDHPESINLAEKIVLASVFPQPKPPFNEPVVITIKNTTVRKMNVSSFKIIKH